MAVLVVAEPFRQDRLQQLAAQSDHLEHRPQHGRLMDRLGAAARFCDDTRKLGAELVEEACLVRP